MSKRTPWTEPYTRRERARIRYDLAAYDVRAFFREGIWQRLAWLLPHQLVLWCFIRAAGHAWVETNKPPEELNYPVVYEAWERRRIRPAALPGHTVVEYAFALVLVIIAVVILFHYL